MKRQNLYLLTAVVTLALIFNYFGLKKAWAYFNPNTPTPEPVEYAESNRIQVALLLDTSSSMNGLIEQAKSQLWQILNQLARTERNGETPELEVALYEYGNTQRKTGNTQILKLTDFTADMDQVSEQLFALTTSGGDEYCGQVIAHSLDQLEWSSNPYDLRLIYIAGNEPFNQGPVPFNTSCTQAKNKDIAVNTIFCGNYQEGIISYWQTGAHAANGLYFNINHNESTVYIPTPYDDQITELNKKLNETYIPFGKDGASKKSNQTRQDLNASSYGKANAADRAAYKSSKNYKADSWDLIDAAKKDKNILRKKEILPAEYENISIEEVELKIEAISTQRSQLKKEIQELDKKRRSFQKENTATKESKSFQNSVQKSIEKQAKTKGYKIKN